MSARRLSGVALVLLAWVLGACATPQTAQLVEAPGALPRQAEIADAPFFPQERFYCGPAALATALVWTGVSVSPEDLAQQVYTPERQGTLQTDIVAAARRNGRLAVPVRSLPDLLAEIAAGHPVLVFQNLALEWYPQWHFAVAVGYDLDSREITLRSGRQPRRVMPFETFERTWRRGDHWALVVLRPDRLPASADRESVLSAAAGLERVGNHPEAAAAYSAILDAWPDSFGALMGLGNARYAEGDLAAAEASFRQAVELRPSQPEGWNNLAYALAGQGRQDEAIEAARKAVRLSPGNEAPYLDTLRDVSKS
jgi:tetratricopeptide (TPR) repeat protein